MPDEKPQITLAAVQDQPTPANLLLDQYKAYVGDLNSIGTRYTTAQAFYWTIVAALIALLAIKDLDKPLASYLKPGFVLVMCFIAAICYVWQMTSRHYRELFGAKLEILKQLERRGLYSIFQTEGELLKRGADKVPSLLAIERQVPFGLMCVALLLALIALCHIVSTT
jgi:hypothetical protein